MYFSQQSSLLHMFYFSLRSFLFVTFICKENLEMHFIHCIQLFLHFNFSFISPLSKYLFPPHFTNLSQYSLLPHYTHFHQQFIITFTHNYFQKDIIPRSSNQFSSFHHQTSSNNFQLFYLIKVIPTANISFFLPYTQFHQLQRTTTTKTTCQQR